MEEGPYVRVKRKRGAPLKYGPDKESSRRETHRQRDATKVYLLSAHDEWRSAKQAYERKLTKPVTNGEFALHLLSVHRKSKCGTCAAIERSEDGERPLDDTETQTIEEFLGEGDSMDDQLVVVGTPQKKQQQGARRRKQSSPQGLHMDPPTEPEAAFHSGKDGAEQGALDLPVESKDGVSTTTRLLQRLHSKDEGDEMDAYTGEDGCHGDDDDDDGLYTGHHEDDEDDSLVMIPKALSSVKYKDDEEEEEWKSSEMSDDPEDEDYGTRKSKRLRKPRKVPPKVVKRVPPRMVRKSSQKPAAKPSRPRITLKLSTKDTPKRKEKAEGGKKEAKQEGTTEAVQDGTMGTTNHGTANEETTRRAPKGRKKKNPPKEKQPVDNEPKATVRGPSIFIRRVNWADLDKKYQCKICNFEHTVPLEACRHLLAVHPEMVGALREFLLSNTVQNSDGEKSLYSIALEQPLPLLLNQQADNVQSEPHPGDHMDKGVDSRIQHFTDMMMPGYMGTTTALPHLAAMPSFQQSFNRPPLFDGSQNGVVPLAPHNLQSMTNAAAALFGMGVALPEGSMIPSNPFVSSSNHEGLSTASPSPSTTHSSMVGTGGQHNGTQQGTHQLPMNPHHIGQVQRPDGTRQTISQPQSPSQASPQVPPQLPRPSSQPPCLPTQMHSQCLPNNHHGDPAQHPKPSHNDPPSHGDQSAKEHLQSPNDFSEPHTNSSQPDPNDTQNSAMESDAAGDSKGFQADIETQVKIENMEEGEDSEKPDEKSSNSPFENDELLTLMERWVKIPLSCPHCNMKLPYMKRKDRHRCRRPSPHVLCDICGKSYPQTYFRFHYKRVHLPQNNVECQYCHREFRPSSLSKHILERHKPFKPYKCGICGKEFNSKKHCDKHEAVHKTEKPHKCPTCNRGFTQRTNMKNHMRQHTGEQPYRCHNCMKSFTHNVSLKNHLKRYHGIDLWQLGHTGGGRPKKE